MQWPKYIIGADFVMGDIASSAAGHQDFCADGFRAIENNDAHRDDSRFARRFSGEDARRQTGCAAAHNRNVASLNHDFDGSGKRMPEHPQAVVTAEVEAASARADNRRY